MAWMLKDSSTLVKGEQKRWVSTMVGRRRSSAESEGAEIRMRWIDMHG